MCVEECRRLFPEGPFGDDDDFSAILKTIANVEVGTPANQRAAQLQSDPHQSTVDSLYDEVEVKKKRKTAQSALHDDLINAQFKRHEASIHTICICTMYNYNVVIFLTRNNQFTEQ